MNPKDQSSKTSLAAVRRTDKPCKVIITKVAAPYCELTQGLDEEYILRELKVLAISVLVLKVKRARNKIQSRGSFLTKLRHLHVRSSTGLEMLAAANMGVILS